jgi:hypothetical protein
MFMLGLHLTAINDTIDSNMSNSAMAHELIAKHLEKRF